MHLSIQQHAYCKTFGFLAFPGLFRAEIEDITAAFAGAVLWLCSDAASFMAGYALAVDGGAVVQ